MGQPMMTEIVAAVLLAIGAALFMWAVVAVAVALSARLIRWGALEDPSVMADQQILTERREIERQRNAAIEAWRQGQ